MADIEHLGDLIPDPKNARAHNPRNVGLIVDALHEVGAARSIVIDESGRVLAGNATIEAAAEAGIERVQVVDADGETIIAVRRTGLTEAQKVRLALLDNRTAELATWDADVLGDLLVTDEALLDGLFTDLELGDLGVDVGDEPVADPGADLSKGQELAEKYGTATGQIWQLGEHRLAVGDCLEVIPQLDKTFDAVITDPPYLTGNAQVPIRGRGVTKRIEESISVGLPWEYSLAWVALCKSPQWVVFCNHIMMGGLHVEIERFAKVSNIFVWYKPNAPRMTRPVPRFDCEFIIWARDEGATCKRMGEFDTSLLNVPMAQAGCFATERILQTDSKKAVHPTQKPLAVVRPFINRLTDQGDIILDPFCGSGTTLIAAQQENRCCYAVEISPGYAAVAIQRWEDLTGEEAVLLQVSEHHGPEQ